jgi:hypothetical protein
MVSANWRLRPSLGYRWRNRHAGGDAARQFHIRRGARVADHHVAQHGPKMFRVLRQFRLARSHVGLAELGFGGQQARFEQRNQVVYNSSRLFSTGVAVSIRMNFFCSRSTSCQLALVRLFRQWASSTITMSQGTAEIVAA